MKRLLLIFIAAVMLLTAGCSAENNQSTVADNSRESSADASNNESKAEEKPQQAADKSSVDVDLTKLSSTMVYSEVFAMMSEPESYIGKTVKARGNFAMYHDEATDAYYFAVLIQDATACCQQGLEFDLKGNHKFPDDYPELGEEITVTGEFTTYTEGNITYCQLKDAAMV